MWGFRMVWVMFRVVCVLCELMARYFDPTQKLLGSWALGEQFAATSPNVFAQQS